MKYLARVILSGVVFASSLSLGHAAGKSNFSWSNNTLLFRSLVLQKAPSNNITYSVEAASQKPIIPTKVETTVMGIFDSFELLMCRSCGLRIPFQKLEQTKPAPPLFLQDASKVESSGGRLSFEMDPSVHPVKVSDFFTTYKDSLKLTKNDTFEVTETYGTDLSKSTTPSEYGKSIQYVHLQQKYNGLRVVPGVYTLIGTDTSQVAGGTGQLAQNLKTDTTPTITESQALDAAKTEVFGDTSSDQSPKGELAISSKGHVNKSDTYQLVWIFSIEDDDNEEGFNVEVSANGPDVGKVLNMIPTNLPGPITWNKNANCKVQDSTLFPCDVGLDGKYRLMCQTDVAGYTCYASMKTLDARGANRSLPILFSDADSIFDNSNDMIGVLAHAGVLRTMNYFYRNFSKDASSPFGWKGFDGSATIPVTTTVKDYNFMPNVGYYDYDNGIVIKSNQRYEASTLKMVVSLGLSFILDTLQPNVPALTMIAHEFTHGIMDHVAKLDYYGEAAALHEGYADIFGCRVWAEFFGQSSDDTTTTKVSTNGCRYELDTPVTYLGEGYIKPADPCNNGEADYACRSHTNAQVMEYVYYLLENGGSGTNSVGHKYSVQAIGPDLAQKIAFETIKTGSMGGGFTFSKARKLWINTAKKLFPTTEKSVTDAWDAVEVDRSDERINYSPANGITKVEAWPTKLSWTHPDTCNRPETIQVSIFDDDFNTPKDSALLSAITCTCTANGNGQKEDCSTSINLDGNMTYYWRVGFNNSDGTISWGNTQDFNTASKKFTPSTASPANPFSVKSTWPSFPGATGYYLRIYEGSNLSPEDMMVQIAQKKIKPITFAATDTQFVGVLKKNKVYTFTWDTTGPGGTFGGDYRPTTVTTNGAQVELNNNTVPEHGLKVVPGDIKFAWDPVVGAEDYLLEISKTNNFASPFYSQPTLKQTSKTVTLSGGDYYWRVTAKGPVNLEGTQEMGDPSVPFLIHVSTLATPPRLTYPPDGSTVPYKLPVTFQWDAVPEADGYQISFYNYDGNANGTSGKLIISHTVSSNSYMGSPSGPITGYCWTVQANKGLLEHGPISAKSCYYIGPSKPTLVSPTAGDNRPVPSGANYQNAEFTWTSEWAPKGTWLVIQPSTANCGTPSCSFGAVGSMSSICSIPANCSYTWYVQAHSPDGQDVVSDTRSFSTLSAPAPTNPTPTKPTTPAADQCDPFTNGYPMAMSPNGVNQTTGFKTFTWFGHQGAKFYRISLAFPNGYAMVQDYDASTVPNVTINGTSICAFNITAPFNIDKYGTYAWTVTAMDGSKNVIATSSPLGFVVPEP